MPFPGLRAGVLVLLLVTWLVFLALYVGNSARATYPWLNHDVAYHSYLARGMLDGLSLYVDLTDDNPPGSPLLLAAVIAAGDRMGLPGFAAQHTLVLGIGLAGVVVLGYSFPRPRDDLTFSLVALAYLLVIVRGNFTNNLWDAPDIPYDFGQREHLFSLLFVPYLMLRVSARPVRVLLYPYLLLLGFVASFKPYWPLMIVAVELVCALDPRRRSRGTPPSLLAGLLLPLPLLFMQSPEAFSTFFKKIIPEYLEGGLIHYNREVAGFLLSALHTEMLGGFLFLAAGCWLALRRRRVERKVALLPVVLAAGAYFSVYDQHRFWSYHAMPFFALTLVPGAFLLARAAGAFRDSRVRRGTVAAALFLALVATGSTYASTVKMFRHYPPLGYSLVPLIQPYRRVMFFSMSVAYCYAPLLLQKEILGPWTVNVELPQILDTPDPTARSTALRAYGARIRETIERLRPDLLVFAPFADSLPKGASVHELLRGARAVPDELYRPVPPEALETVDPQFGRWVFYERREDGPPGGVSDPPGGVRGE